MGRATRSTSLAVFLSFLWPGLGQWYQGRRRPALLYAIPVLAAAVVIGAQLVGGVEAFVAVLITPSFALTVFILVALLGFWRLIAMGDAFMAGTIRGARPARPILGALAIVVVAAHLWVGSVTWALYDASNRIFVGDAGPDRTPPTGSIDPSDNGQDFVAPPFATPQTTAARINVLVTGIDSGHGRDHALTDTLMLVSIDPETKDVAMLSFPRDLSGFPLWDGRTYGGKINSLMTYARLHQTEFPDGGLPTLAKEIGYLAGVEVHYFASINLEGFQKIIELVGGVDVVNPKPINDPVYDWFDGTKGFQLAAGPVHLDGRLALAYVRSRYGAGDSDFTRAARQQQVLASLRKRLTQPAMIAKLPELLDATASVVRTNFPSSRIGEMVELAGTMNDDGMARYVLGPPYAFHPPSNTTNGIYTLRLDMDRLAALSVKIFGEDSRYSAAR